MFLYNGIYATWFALLLGHVRLQKASLSSLGHHCPFSLIQFLFPFLFWVYSLFPGTGFLDIVSIACGTSGCSLILTAQFLFQLHLLLLVVLFPASCNVSLLAAVLLLQVDHILGLPALLHTLVWLIALYFLV